MGKAPAFQFYPNDWTRDLEEHPLEIEGAWIRICCKLWWSENKGELTKSLIQWARILRIDEDKAISMIDYIKKEKIGDVTFSVNVTDRNKNITVRNRRMFRDEKTRKDNKDRQQRFRNKQKRGYNDENNADITPPSSSSSSSSPSKNNQRVATPPLGDSFKNAKDYVGDLWEQIRDEGTKVWELRNDFNVAQWISKAVKNKSHPQAILDTLIGIKDYISDCKNPVAYTNTVLRTKSGNAYEKEAFADHKENMKMWAEIADGLKGKEMP